MEQPKRNVAYKLRIGDLLAAKPLFEGERLAYLELNTKQIIRVNLIANIIDKYVQEGERKFASLTLDDATGQIRVKTFGDEVEKCTPFTLGDTILVIGFARFWNQEVYLAPEIMKKRDPAYLLIRKLEIEKEKPQPSVTQLHALKDKIIEMVKAAEKNNGVDIEQLILTLQEQPALINQEIKKLLEDGLVYEPRPGKLRWLG